MDGPSFSIPRRSGPPQKQGIPHVKKVVIVASGKGGVGKSTIAGTFSYRVFCLSAHSPVFLS